MLHSADQLALQEVQPLERSLVHIGQRCQRAVDGTCVHKQMSSKPQKATPSRAADCVPHTSRACGISGSPFFGLRATSSELRYSVWPWNSVRRSRCCPLFDSGSRVVF